MKFVFLLVALLVAAPCVLGDTPANCSYDDITGLWAFYYSDLSTTNTIDCSKETPLLNNQILLTLINPNLNADGIGIAIDPYGIKGTWTLIYNQGFEIVFKNHKHFAFFDYSVDNDTVVSHCNNTFVGWAHDILGHNWACVQGGRLKASGDESMEKSFPKVTKMPVFDLEHKYFPNKDFVGKINSKTNLWRAGLYPELEGMTFGDLLRRGGGIPKYGRFKFPKSNPGSEDIINAASSLPDSFDWRSYQGVEFVTPVRNQGTCGSCYAFASMAMLEARLKIIQYPEKWTDIVFSPQDAVSCSQYAQGCAGGFPYLIAGKYAQDFGVVEESCYPYLGKDEKCSEKPGCLRYYSTDYYYIGGSYGNCSEPAMRLELVNNGPFAVSFEVYQDFHAYKNGIYNHTTVMDQYNPWEITNHVVLVVGYGEENGVKYWSVKNSWGADWGEFGYFRILRGEDVASFESMAVAATPIDPHP